MSIQSLEQRTGRKSGPARAVAINSPESPAPGLPRKTAHEIHTWLTLKVAELAGIDVSAIDASEPVAYYGLDSVAAVSLSGELQDWLGQRVSPTLVYDCPSIEAMVIDLSSSS